MTVSRKIWKRIILVGVISILTGLILKLQLFNSGKNVNTATHMDGVDWYLIATIVAGVFFLLGFILVLILNSRRKSSKSAAGAKSYGKIWNWIIPIVIVSAIIGAILIVPKYYNNSGKGRIGIGRSAFYSWKKLDYQYGYNPNDRSAGPFKAKITSPTNSEKLSFEFSTRNGMCYFEGWKESDKFKGKWRCPNTGDGGDWELKEDLNKKGFYIGLEKDSDLPEGKPSELIILN